jgi:hypothetical protein
VFGYNCYQPTTTLVKKFPDFYRIRRLLTMLTKTLPLVPHVSEVLTPHLSSLRSNLILYTTESEHLIQTGSSASGSRLKFCPVCFTSYGCYIPRPVHAPWFYRSHRPICGKNRAYVLWRYTITYFFQAKSLPPNQAYNCHPLTADAIQGRSVHVPFIQFAQRMQKTSNISPSTITNTTQIQKAQRGGYITYILCTVDKNWITWRYLQTVLW